MTHKLYEYEYEYLKNVLEYKSTSTSGLVFSMATNWHYTWLRDGASFNTAHSISGVATTGHDSNHVTRSAMYVWPHCSPVKF